MEPHILIPIDEYNSLKEIKEDIKDKFNSDSILLNATSVSFFGMEYRKVYKIVNAPEVGILGVSKSDFKPKWNGKEFEPRLMVPLSLSYDHRVIDGAEGAAFSTEVANNLTDLRRLVL